jgi:hypothetical protein
MPQGVLKKKPGKSGAAQLKQGRKRVASTSRITKVGASHPSQFRQTHARNGHQPMCCAQGAGASMHVAMAPDLSA